MNLLHDYLLVKEVVNNDTIEGTKLKVKYDDSERFMIVEIIAASKNLVAEYLKYYPGISHSEAHLFCESVFAKGNRLIINRVAKTPYKDGLYFISFKDVIALESSSVSEGSKVADGQLSIFDINS